jgi:hypothetical protein
MISNPMGAFGYDTSLDGQSYRRVASFQANGTIAEHDAVQFELITSATTGGLPTVIALDVSATATHTTFIGVAQHAAVDGEPVLCVIEGLTLCNIDDATIVGGDIAHPHATVDGKLDGTDGAATHVIGEVYGVWLSAHDVGGTNKAFLWVNKT